MALTPHIWYKKISQIQFWSTLYVNHKPQAIVVDFECENSCSLCCSNLHAVFLSAYAYSIQYKGTKRHANADNLSHLPVQGEYQDATATVVSKISFTDELPIMASDIAEETSEDSVLSRIYYGGVATKRCGR